MASAAMVEAKGLFALLKCGETVPAVRKLIGNASPERRAVLTAFDALVIRHKYSRQRRFSPAERAAIEAAIKAGLRPGEIRRQFFMSEDSLLKFRRRMGVYRDCRYKPQLPGEVQTKVLQLLPSCSVARISETVGLSACRVRAIAATVGGAAALKTVGQGRRVRGELRNQILASLQAGTRPTDVRRQFGVSMVTVAKLRRVLGDLRDRRRDRKLNDVQVQEIRAALAGHTRTWRTLAREFGVGLTTIGNIFRHEKGY